ncbi:MAG: hypothetical protein WEB58_20830 [Planctomycetaceae bacterium]
MKFRSTKSAAPYLNRRDQYRLLTLVAMLSMIIVAANAAKNPKNWYWLTGPPKKQQSSQPATAPHADADPAVPANGQQDPVAETDTSAPLADDEFVSRLNSDDAVVENEKADAVEAPVPRRTETDDDSAATHTEIVAPLEPELLRPIKDSLILIQPQEAEAYYEIVRRLKTYSDAGMEQAAEKGFTYPVIMAQPDLLRGRVLTIEGELERLTPLAPPSDAEDVGILYAAWLFTRESGNNPIRVVCLDPGGFKPTEQFSPRPHVRFAGYFFKLYGYETQYEEVHKAPLFLARGLEKIPGSVSQANEPEMARYVFGVLAVFALLFVAMVVRFTLNDRGPRRRHRESLIAANSDEIESLKNIETFDVSEMLRRLSEEPTDESELESTPRRP